MTDFRMQGSIDPTAIAALAQKQAQLKAEQENKDYAQKMQGIKDVATITSSMVSSSIEASKLRQKKDWIRNLSDSLSAQVPPIQTPVEGPSMPGQPSPMISAPNVNKQEQIRASVNIAPESFAKQLAEQLIPGPSFNGTPPRSFESLLTSKVNSGEMTLQQAAEALSTYKPNNSITGYDENQNPVTFNSKALPASSTALNTVQAPKGGIQPKPERPSETELGKQSDLGTVDLALAEVQKNIDNNFVGPVAGRLNTAAQIFDVTASDKRANFISAVNSYRNSMIKAITGAQMSEPEAARIMKQLPNEKMSVTDFKAKLKLSRELLAKSLKLRQGNLKQAGYTGVNTSPSVSPETDNNDPLGIR